MSLDTFLPETLKQDVVLRSPGPDDTDAMFAYFESLGEVSRGFFHPHPFDLERAEAICSDTTPGTYRVIALSGGRIVGYAWFGIAKDHPYPVLGIGISDEFQGRRLGGALMDALTAEARRRGHAGLRLTVYKNNERAVRLYSSRGYKITGEMGKQHVMDLVFD